MAPSLEDIVKGLTKFVERGHEFKPGERDLLIAAAEQLVELSNLLGAEKSANNYLSFKIDCYSKDICKVAAERDEARLKTRRILKEIDCRLEHGAESNGHLEGIRNLFKEDS